MRTDGVWEPVGNLMFAIAIVGLVALGIFQMISWRAVLLCVSFLLMLGYVLFPYVTKFIPAHAGGTCRACGYDLRGLTGDNCPECGATITPKEGND